MSNNSTSSKHFINQTRKDRLSNPDTNNKSYVNRGGFDYVISSMLLVCIVGMSVKIFFGAEISSDGKYGPANSVIYGYGIVALSVLTLIFISYAVHDRIGNVERKGNPASLIEFIKSFLGTSLPSIFVVTELVWIITLNINYYTNINKGMVAPEFYKLTSGTTLIFIFQLTCLFQYLKYYIKRKTDPNSFSGEDKSSESKYAFATYFVTTINLILIGMMSIILQFFSTDG